MTDLPSRNSLEKTTDTTPSVADDTSRPIDAVGQALFERLGVGGMGEVYRFGDDALQRDLAIKILKVDFQGDAAAEARFLREARLTGSLQHPGIVPVHQLGRLADGRPFYTMKLVRGRTMSDLLRDEPQGPERLPRLLAVLEKVCQAVAFAHSRGVIHRDLKPSNVMVGEFGEVQVMDWGLAKELSRSEPIAVDEAMESMQTAAWTDEGEAAIQTNPFALVEAVETAAWAKESESLSRAGAVMGTPAYMPPEQAAGDWDIVDERADVFALGAILCELLTGWPPYHGAANRDDLLRRARRGDWAESRRQLEKCGAAAMLVELCRDCLAAEHLQRPRHAGVVAEQLASYQAEVRERLRQAELERVVAETRAKEEQARAAVEAERAREAQARANAERRAQRRLRGLLLVVGAALCLGAGASWWIITEREARTREDIARMEGIARANEASNYYMRAEILYAKGQRNEAIPEYRKSIELQPENCEYWFTLAEVLYELKRWDESITAYESVIRLKPEYAVAYRDLGDALVKTGQTDRAIGAYQEAIRLEPNYADTHDDLGDCLRKKGQLDEAITEYRKAVQLEPDYAPYYNDLGIALGDKGDLNGAIIGYHKALDLDPTDVIVHTNLGNTLRRKGDLNGAIAYYRKALELDPKHVNAHNYLGNALSDKGDLNGAIACYRKALELDPKYVNVYNGLGNALSDKGELDAAIASYRKALDFNPKFAYAHNGLGNALYDEGDLDGAITCYRRALDFNPKFAYAHNGLGNALRDKGDLDGAIACYRKALELDPKYVNAHFNLGFALVGLVQLDAAAAEYRKIIELGNTGAAQRLQRCQRLLALGDCLALILKGQLQPQDAAQRIDLASLTYNMRRFAMSTRLYADAFAADPKLASDLTSQHRYSAACSAVLAAAGRGEDARLLPDKVMARFRSWALGWLRDHLTAYVKLAEKNNPEDNKMIQQKLASWRRDPDLATLREPQALDRLPDNERAAWQTLWRDVDELTKRVATKAN